LFGFRFDLLLQEIVIIMSANASTRYQLTTLGSTVPLRLCHPLPKTRQTSTVFHGIIYELDLPDSSVLQEFCYIPIADKTIAQRYHILCTDGRYIVVTVYFDRPMVAETMPSLTLSLDGDGNEGDDVVTLPCGHTETHDEFLRGIYYATGCDTPGEHGRDQCVVCSKWHGFVFASPDVHGSDDNDTDFYGNDAALVRAQSCGAD
jgi:hypothetical protein